MGKTTLARLMADGFDAQFIAISAVLGGVKDIRDAVTVAQVAQGQGRRTILFVDEVHRFNKVVKYFLNQILTRLIVQYFVLPMVQRREAMSDLFAQEPSAPLAEALRPKTLDEVIGQSHLLGEGKPLRLAFQSGKPHSMIFWGRLVSEKQHLHVSRPLHSSASSSPCRRSCLVLKTSEKQWNKQGSTLFKARTPSCL